MQKGIIEFHFVMNPKMYSQINQLSQQLKIRKIRYHSQSAFIDAKKALQEKHDSFDGTKIKSDWHLSKTIVFIIELMNAFLEKNHLKAKEKKSRYKKVKDSDEDVSHVHCYMPVEFYRKMKLLHQDLNTYSIAQILRRMIKYFLKGCSKYGVENFINRLYKIKKIWHDKKTVYIAENKTFIKQLSYQYLTFYYCRTIYSNNSRTYTIQLLE